MGADAIKKFTEEGLMPPGGLESNLTVEQVQGTFTHFESKIDTISENSEVDEGLLSEVSTIELMVDLVEDYSVEEIEALKVELALDEEVRKEAEESGFENKEGFEGIGVNVKLIWILVNILPE